jgi:prepilin-type N-terminal cleavage/methylation domain-containing protein/prepilin-type processing-associated H-X9-DG protein
MSNIAPARTPVPHDRSAAALMPPRRAFTLVELLVVIGVIALLISILIPSLARAQAMARKTKCLNTLKQLGTCNQMYLGEFKDWEIPCRWGYSPSSPPAPPTPPPPIAASGPARSWANIWYLAKFFSSPNIDNGLYGIGAICPDASFAFSWGSAGEVSGYYVTLSYGMNTDQLSQSTSTATPVPASGFYGAPHYFSAWKRQQIVQPTDKIQFVDAIGSVNSGGSPPYTTRYWIPGWGEKYDPSIYPAISNIVAYRHLKGANVLYYDGHAEWRHFTELQVDPADASTTINKRQWQPKAR